MLTFEKVLEVFQDYLSKDNMYEIVTTSRGYTVLEWDSEFVCYTLYHGGASMAALKICGRSCGLTAS